MGKAMQSALLILFIILSGIIGIKYFIKKNESEKIEKVDVFENTSHDENNKPDNELKKAEEKNSELLDINEASLSEFRAFGLTANTANNIIDFRKQYGCIRNYEELDTIKGVGVKTLEKIKQHFFIDEKKIKSIPFVRININDPDNKETLLKAGFTKKECTAIEAWKKKNGSVFSNIDLLNILGDKRYSEMNEKIKYSN